MVKSLKLYTTVPQLYANVNQILKLEQGHLHIYVVLTDVTDTRLFNLPNKINDTQLFFKDYADDRKDKFKYNAVYASVQGAGSIEHYGVKNVKILGHTPVSIMLDALINSKEFAYGSIPLKEASTGFPLDIPRVKLDNKDLVWEVKSKFGFDNCKYAYLVKEIQCGKDIHTFEPSMYMLKEKVILTSKADNASVFSIVEINGGKFNAHRKERENPSELLRQVDLTNEVQRKDFIDALLCYYGTLEMHKK